MLELWELGEVARVATRYCRREFFFLKKKEEGSSATQLQAGWFVRFLLFFNFFNFF